MRPPRLFPLLLFALLQNFAFAQTNDSFANRITLGGASASAVANTASATSESGEPSHAGAAPGKSLWWSWTAPASGVVNFSAFGSSLSSSESGKELAVYTGGSLNALSEAGSSNDQPFFYYPAYVYGKVDTGPSFNLQVTAGTVYQIVLESTTTSAAGPAVLNINQPPTIVSNATASGTIGSAFSHNVQASNLPSGYTASGLPAGLSINPFSGVISGTPAQTGTFAVALTAANGAGAGTGMLTLTIGVASAVPAAPVLTVDAMLSGTVGAPFSQSVYASGSPTSYTASGLPPGLSIDTRYGYLRGTPTTAGIFSVPVSATNGVGTGSGLVTIRIAAAPEIPVFSSAAAASGTVGQSFSHYLSASNSPVSYAVGNLPPGLGFDFSASTIVGIPTTAGVSVVPISATNAGGTGTAQLTITVGSTVPPAGLQITSSAKITGVIGSAFTYAITAAGTPVAFSASGLPPGLSLNSQTGYITGSPLVPGSFPVVLSATDGSATASATLALKVIAAATSTTATSSTFPYMTSSAGAAGVVGSSFSYTTAFANATGGSGSPTYSAAGLPPGLAISSTSGGISGTPSAAGNYAVNVMVTIPSYTGVPTFGSGLLTIAIASSSPAATLSPVITSSANVTGYTGSSFSHTLAATDKPTAFAASGLPAGLSLNVATGAITGMPTAQGVFPVAVSATNSIGTGSATVTITVGATSTPTAAPVITSDATSSGTVGSSLSYYLYADNSPTSYSVSNLPPGLIFNSGSAQISGTPTTAGVFVVPITASNAVGQVDARVTFTIAAVLPPVLTGDAAVSTTVGSSFSYYPYASNSPTSYAAGNLPPGLTLNTTSGTVSGTPTTTGTYVVPYSATNAGGTGTATVTMSVVNGAAPSFSSSSLAVQNGTVGAAFSASYSATGSPTNYAAGNLPPGLSQSATTGQITGTPTTAGTFAVPLSATNASGTGTATLTIVIAPSGTIPSIPVVASSAAAGGLAGTAFSYTITANNAPASYAATGLPAGLSLNTGTGVISGTPAAGGVSDVAISATNAGGTGTATLRLAIAAAPNAAPVISSSAGATAMLNEAFYFPVTASQLPASFTATGLPAGLTLNASTGVISGTPTASGTFTVALTADNAVGSGAASLTLRVLTGSGVPRLKSSAGAAAVKSTAFSYTITATYSPTSFSATGLPPGLVLNTSTGVISGTPTTSGTYAVTASAFTSSGTASGTVTIRVSDAATTVPVITSSAGVFGAVGDPFGCAVTASNSPTSFAATGLPAGLSINAATGLISGTPSTSGTFSVALSATNGAGTGTATMVVKTASLSTPRFTSSAGAGGLVGTALTYTLTASPTPSSYSINSPLPAGLSYNSNSHQISGTPTAAGSYVISFGSSGGTGTASASLRLSILSDPVSPPVISSRAAAAGYPGTPFLYSITASERPTLFAATNLPPGLTLDPATGIIFGQPSAAGAFAVPVSAANAVGTGDAVITLTILGTQPAPVISSGLVAAGSVGASGVIYRIVASESPSSYTASGLPPGLSLDPVSGSISGRPTAAGVYSVPISASNAGGTASATVTFVIDAPSLPIIASDAAALASVGVDFDYYLYSNPTATSYAAGSLPPGLFFDASAGYIRGVPTAVGTFSVPLTATNSAGAASATLTLVIVPAPPLPVFSGPDATVAASVGQSVSSYVSASSYFGSRYLSAVVSASGLPPGLSCDGSYIAGTPTTPGVYSVTLSATSAGGTSTAIAVFYITAATPTVSPIITSGLGTTGVVGRAFGFQVSAGNLPTGYAAVGLPPGLGMNGTSGYISGTPTTAGDYAVSVSVSNAVGSTSIPLRIRITAAPTDLPVITSAASTSIGDTSTYPYSYPPAGANYTIAASNGPATFSASGLPAGLSLNSATGLISGIPLVGGTFLVPISATNAVGTRSAVLTIFASAPAISLTASAQVLGSVGTRLSYTIQTNLLPSYFYSGTPSFGVTYAASGLPPGMSVNTATGVISGTPLAAGNFPVTISATNLAGSSSAVVTFSVAAASALPPSTPKFTSASAGAAGALNLPFSYSFWADGLPTSLTAGSLPPGLSVSVQSGTLNGVATLYGKISGTPLESGTFAVPISASNSVGTTNAIVTLKIANAPTGPIITSDAASVVQLGATVSYWIYTAYDEISASGVKSYAATNLPPGLSLDSATGKISGTPMMGGVFPVTISATVGGATGTAVWTVSVQSSSAPLATPVITASAGALAFVGVPFTFPLSAGNTPDNLAVSALPDGLAFALSSTSGPGAATKSGTISGIPLTPGTFTIPVSASNAAGASGAVVTLTVRTPQAALPFIVLEPASQSVPAGSDAVFTAAASGIAAPTFQWLRDGQPIAGATSATLLLPAVSAADFAGYSVIATNASGSATSQTAVLSAATDFATWQSANFSAAEIADGFAAEDWDFNGDGTLNLLDYALGRDPRTGLGGSLPSVTRPDATGCLQITFPRDTRDLDITYIVEATGDLGAWTPIASSIHGAAPANLGGAGSVAETGGTVRSVTVQDGAAGGIAPRFLRLKITRP